MQKNYQISFIRLIAFLSIFTCHVFQYFNHEFAFWLNVGVQIFLVISGYLYGKAKIDDDVVFYIKRAKKILLPYYIVVISIIIIELFIASDNIDIVNIVRVLLLNTTIKGGGHLWFVPTILMCYVLTPLLGRVCDKFGGVFGNDISGCY